MEYPCDFHSENTPAALRFSIRSMRNFCFYVDEIYIALMETCDEADETVCYEIDLAAIPYDDQKNFDANVKKWRNSERVSVKRWKSANFSNFFLKAKERASKREVNGAKLPAILGLPFIGVKPGTS